MEHIQLNNGVYLPSIGYGTFPSKEVLIDNLPLAQQTGYRLLDTSDDYGNEVFVGTARKQTPAVREMIVSTKISNVAQLWNFRRDFEAQKKRLEIPAEQPIDLLLLHFPYPYLYVDAWKEMEKLYREGQCRAIGVCNFEIPHLETLDKYAQVKPMVNQIELHPLFQRKELCQYCKENGIAVMSYSPVARMDKRLIENEILMTIAERHQKSVVQVILRWDIQHGYIPLPAASKKTHMESNMNVYDFVLTDEEMMQIDTLDSGIRIRFDTNTMWSYSRKAKLLMRRIQYKFHLHK